MQREYKPLKLMPNVIYPTYQLHAQVANNETPPDDALKIVILEVMAWLRERFRDLDIPEEIRLPGPGDYKELQLFQLKSFKVDSGYTVEVGFREEDRAWALELREPDLGPRPEDTGNNRKPAPGRTFTTNIAVRIRDGIVDCGFRTMVSELKGETIPCEVFRLAVVKRLAENPLIGLRQDRKFKLSMEPHVIDNYTDLKQLTRFLSEEKRELPAVVFVRCPMGESCTRPETIFSSLKLPKLANLTQALNPGEDQLKRTITVDNEGYFDQVAAMARHRMGYAHVFFLAGDMYKKYNELTGTSLTPGESVVVLPANMKGKPRFFTKAEDPRTRNANMKEIEDLTQGYLKGQKVGFEGVWFLPEILRRDAEDALQCSMGAKGHEKAKEALRKHYTEELEQEKRKIHGEYAVEMARLQKELDGRDEEIEKLRARMIADKEEAKKELELFGKLLEETADEISWLKGKAAMPQNPCDVAEWVHARYPGKLVFHKKAEALMADVKPEEVDMELLCGALEFLAEEYRMKVTGRMSEDEMNAVCSRKYGRPFVVDPLKGVSVETYSADYKIKYGTGKDGKPHETTLDRHLKVGNDTENLLRIYFLYDAEKQLIVVGSLPKHLKTVKYG